MGFTDTSSALPIFYNVVHAVGKNAPNQKDDVMLVQYLLLHRYKNVIPEGKPKGEMKVDGFYGGITQNWILKFQLDIMLHQKSIYADGRVDRVRNTLTLTGSLSKTIYTLIWLNWIVAYEDPVAFANLPQFVPLLNPMNVPPPSNDIVVPKPPTTQPPAVTPGAVPAVGGA